LASPPENNRYYLVYWPEEQSVSSVRSDGITSPSLVDLKVGVDCKVSLGRRLYNGKIAATGICPLDSYQQALMLYLGNNNWSVL